MNTKRAYKFLSFGMIIGFGFLSACTKAVDERNARAEFQTKYSQEEHVQRITEQTQRIFQEEIQQGVIIDYSVELVYAFYDDTPEYFLVEIEYAEEWNGVYYTNYPRFDDDTPSEIEYTTKYKHLIGVIENDTYNTGLRGYFGKGKQAFKDGKSCYALLGYADSKKYYGAGHFAVEKNGEIVNIYYSLAQGPVGLLWIEESFEIGVVSEEQEKQYMLDNRKNATFSYWSENNAE